MALEDELVDVSETLETQRWQKSEVVYGWGDARDRNNFLSAVDLGSDNIGLDKEAHQPTRKPPDFVFIYEEKVAKWKSNNPGKRMTGTVSDKLHTQAIVQHSEMSAGGRSGRPGY